MSILVCSIFASCPITVSSCLGEASITPRATYMTLGVSLETEEWLLACAASTGLHDDDACTVAGLPLALRCGPVHQGCQRAVRCLH